MKEWDIPYIAGLVTKAQQNNSDAFAELYALTYNKVYNYARHYLRNDFLAQDALQEIYISALKNICKLNDPTLFIAWLNRISFNVCFDMSSSQKNNTDNTADAELLEIIEDDHIYSNPEKSYQQKDEHLRLQKALSQLPFQERQVITMRFYNNMKLEEIAAACGVSRSTVKRLLASGESTLKRLMNG